MAFQAIKPRDKIAALPSIRKEIRAGRFFRSIVQPTGDLRWASGQYVAMQNEL